MPVNIGTDPALPPTEMARLLAYLFGFGLTAIPLVRGGRGAGAVISTAVAADTVSFAFAANRHRIARGKGCAHAHEH